MKSKLVLVALLIACRASVLAQGTTFTYQGRLDDGANTASGIYDLRFAIYDAAGGGAQQGNTLTTTATAVSNGLFTVTLDFGNQFPGANRWLEIGVRTNGAGAFSPLSPRQPLTATPYAVRAVNAATAASVSGSIAASQLTGTISSNNIAAGSISSGMLAAGAVGSNQLAAGAVTTTALAEGAVTAGKVFSSLQLLTTLSLTNPTLQALDQFGSAVAVVGTDKILVGANLDDAGATNAGAAHLFAATGNWLATLTNPAPAVDDHFGFAVAAVGADKLLVGAYQDDTGALNAGSAYLFHTNGALLLTLTNPSPAGGDGFGYAVTAAGSHGLLVGSFRDNLGSGQFGAAYLYDLAGNLTLTITNPTPASLDLFGAAVAAVGADKFLIGASSDDVGANNSGVAYLFHTNGTLLTTITNPTPAVGDNFGSEVVAVGTDQVLITAPADNTGASGAGAAYLFDLAGTLLTTFTNPTPTASDAFGSAATAVGLDRVLIGTAADDTGAANAGAAYLFDLAGNLILTVTNPAPATADNFGSAVAALDAKHIVVGASQDDRGVNDAGGVFVLTFDTFTPGLVAEAVRLGAVDSASIASGAIQSFQLANGAVGTEQLAEGAVTTTALAEGAVTSASVATVSNWFALTIANPTPASGDFFGISVAAVGSDRVLIGKPEVLPKSGTAYLFDIKGALLTTFTNPIPYNDGFGSSVASFGNDGVLIGAIVKNSLNGSARTAYLFKTDGLLLTTFTNPAPASDKFGYAVAGVGSDLVLIGAHENDAGASVAGAAYLFRTNGTLVTTFTNPTPATSEYFGYAVASVGSDRVLIGAYGDDTGANQAGAVYLFRTNGTLLTTFTNPTPAAFEHFGSAIAAVGSDRVLIGASRDYTGASNAGAAYLFSTNGTLLTTFTNPIPVGSDYFGNSVAVVGSDRVLIGAYGKDTGATNAGAAYLFSTNGTLITTLANPSPAAGDEFGSAVSAVGSDRVLIGAFGDDTGAASAGAAYLFSLENYTPGLIAESVKARSVTTASLEDGAVTPAKLDATIGVWTRSSANVFRLDGNVGIGTNNPAQKLHVVGNILATGTITPNSDRNLKTDFVPVDVAAVLDQVVRLPIQQWRFQAEPETVKHLGPMAQDFRAAFGLGEIPTAISTVDADGVALAAIQGLNQKVESGNQKAETRMDKLETENAELKAELTVLKRLVEAMQHKLSEDKK